MNDNTALEDGRPGAVEQSVWDAFHSLRWAENDAVAKAIRLHLMAALQLWPLRNVEVEIPRDEPYVTSAQQAAAQARAATDALLT